MDDMKSLYERCYKDQGCTGPAPEAPAQKAVWRKCQCDKNTKARYFFFLLFSKYKKISMPSLFATINVA